MARSRTPKKSPRKRPARRAPRLAGRDPEQIMMEEAAAEMVEVISCPIMIAEDQGERLVGALVDAQETRDLAILAERLHPDAPVAPLLAEVAMTLHRHAGELAWLLDRLIAHTDHDQPHEHVEPDDDAIRELLRAMFRDPFEESETQR